MTLVKLTILGGVLMLQACMTAPAASPPTAPPELLQFYTDADAYRLAAERRACANPSLQPSLRALEQRLRAARDTLIARYGTEQVQGSRVAVIVPAANECGDPAALANALQQLERSIADLEAALK